MAPSKSRIATSIFGTCSKERGVKQSVTTLLAAISLLSVIGAGCGKKDSTLEAAPPPGPNAVPEAGGGQPKQMPGILDLHRDPAVVLLLPHPE
jgi:hypothetical protein